MNSLERALIEKAGNEHGWEHIISSTESGVTLASARHRAQVAIAKQRDATAWDIDLPAGLIRQELARSFPLQAQGDGRFSAADIDQLAALLRRAAELAQSLPNQAAVTYRERVRKALASIPPNGTEVERMVKQRVGQDTFREALMDYWGGACAVTGIDVPEVLRASHSKPWADCATDDERLDVFNGLLLAANLDALFDRGFITFDSSGRLTISARLSVPQRASLRLSEEMRLRWIAPEHEAYLSWHRDHLFCSTR